MLSSDKVWLQVSYLWAGLTFAHIECMRIVVDACRQHTIQYIFISRHHGPAVRLGGLAPPCPIMTTLIVLTYNCCQCHYYRPYPCTACVVWYCSLCWVTWTCLSLLVLLWYEYIVYQYLAGALLWHLYQILCMSVFPLVSNIKTHLTIALCCVKKRALSNYQTLVLNRTSIQSFVHESSSYANMYNVWAVVFAWFSKIGTNVIMHIRYAAKKRFQKCLVFVKPCRLLLCLTVVPFGFESVAFHFVAFLLFRSISFHADAAPE